MNVAFVVQRYGREVLGGAELHCRLIAELLKDDWKVDVLTTCAKDHVTWENFFPEGEQKVNGVSVKRFRVKKPRKIKKFNKMCQKVYRLSNSRKDELDWMTAQGPDCPKLQKYIRNNRDHYEVFIFYTYLYATTFFGLPPVADKAILIPTAHDETPIYLSIFKELFEKPKGFIFQTPEEKNFLTKTFNLSCRISDIIGVGIENTFSDDQANRLDFRIPDRFILYIGRIDQSKSCDELFDFWERYKKKNSSDLMLALIGRPIMKIPKRDDIINLGMLSNTEKLFVMKKSKCMIMPSAFESLSIAILEAWMSDIPVIVNGKCEVTKGQCLRSNGGLWYENSKEFEASLNFILENSDVATGLAANGKRYVEENYSWDKIKTKYVRLVNRFLNTYPPNL